MQGSTARLDLRLVPGNIALKCKWEVLDHTTLGSAHFPITCNIGMEIYKQTSTKQTRWRFVKADWDKFNKLCIYELVKFSTEDDLDTCCTRLN